MNKRNAGYGDFVLTALFAAIIFLLTFTPIGFVNLGLIKATIVHVPVIIGSIVLGPKRGAVLGGLFGAASFISNCMTPSLLSFAFCPLIPVPGSTQGSFWALLVCFAPRVLVGVVPYYVFTGIQKLLGNRANGEYLSLVVGGVAGSVTNTVFVMGLIFVLFRDAYAAAKGIPVQAVAGAVLSVVAVNGVPEAIAASVVTVAVGKALLQLRRRMQRAAMQKPAAGES